MKKHSLILALALGLIAFRGHGQGTVTFGNNSSTTITNFLTMQRVVAGTTFRVSLYYLPDQPIAPTREEMHLLGVQIGASGPIAPAAGLYAAGTRTTPLTTAGAGFAWFQVRAWESAFGTSYEAVLNAPPQGGRTGCVGTSNIIRVKTGDPVNNITPGALTAFGLQSFFVCVVPEPSSLALAAMGIGAWLLLRSRKSSDTHEKNPSKPTP